MEVVEVLGAPEQTRRGFNFHRSCARALLHVVGVAKLRLDKGMIFLNVVIEQFLELLQGSL